MSGLSHLEKQKLELELGMKSGWVLNFSNRTFEEFFREVVKVEIFDSKYNFGTGSKANRMRAFWTVASDDQLRSLFSGLLEGWIVYATGPIPDSARLLLEQLVKRLGGVSGGVTCQPTKSIDLLDQKISLKLSARLLEVTSAPPQKRGYEFEQFLKELFNAFGLSARASFRLIARAEDVTS